LVMGASTPMSQSGFPLFDTINMVHINYIE
jgi:hypothetical protein